MVFVNFADVPHVSDLVVFVVRLHHINTPVTKHHPRRVCFGCKLQNARRVAGSFANVQLGEKEVK